MSQTIKFGIAALMFTCSAVAGCSSSSEDDRSTASTHESIVTGETPTVGVSCELMPVEPSEELTAGDVMNAQLGLVNNLSAVLDRLIAATPNPPSLDIRTLLASAWNTQLSPFCVIFRGDSRLLEALNTVGALIDQVSTLPASPERTAALDELTNMKLMIQNLLPPAAH